jgi:hypothetical protein
VPAGGKPKSKAPIAIIIGAVLGLIVLAAVAALVVVPALTGDDDDDDQATPTTQTTDDDSPDTTDDDSPDTTDDDSPDTTDDDEPSGGSLPDGQTPPSFGDAALDALGESCLEGDMATCDVLFRVTDVGSVEEAYGSTCGGRTDEVSGGCTVEFEGEWDLPAAQSPSALSGDAEFEDLAADCEDGDLAACDDLYAVTPIDSDFEAYGQTCGGRIPVEAKDLLISSSCETDYGTANQ